MNELAQILGELQKPLPDGLAVTKPIGAGGRPMTYLEGYTVIDQANAIFGHDGWGMQVLSVDLKPVGHGLYVAVVRVNVTGWPIKEDVGCCAVPSDNQAGHDTAYKGSITDAMKRALRQFGNQFGNSLYDPEDPNRQPAGQREPQPSYAQRQRQQERPPDTRQTVNRPGDGIVEREPLEAWGLFLANMKDIDRRRSWEQTVREWSDGVAFEDLSKLQQTVVLQKIKTQFTVRQGQA